MLPRVGYPRAVRYWPLVNRMRSCARRNVPSRRGSDELQPGVRQEEGGRLHFLVDLEAVRDTSIVPSLWWEESRVDCRTIMQTYPFAVVDPRDGMEKPSELLRLVGWGGSASRV